MHLLAQKWTYVPMSQPIVIMGLTLRHSACIGAVTGEACFMVRNEYVTAGM